MGIKPTAQRRFMIVENVAGAPIAGTVLVHYDEGAWTRGGAWFGWLGRIRTDLLLDPGPYTPEERRRWERIKRVPVFLQLLN